MYCTDCIEKVSKIPKFKEKFSGMKKDIWERYKKRDILQFSMTKSDLITNIAIKRGFFFPTAEIYNAKAGFWTYGHLGTLMKRKFENLWRFYFLSLNDNYFEIEGNNILPKKVFEGS